VARSLTLCGTNLTLYDNVQSGGRARGALVRYAFDNDASGNKVWQQVKEAFPRAEAIVRERPPSGAKDWNDALRAQDRRQEPVEEREWSPEHGHGNGKGGERDDMPGHRR